MSRNKKFQEMKLYKAYQRQVKEKGSFPKELGLKMEFYKVIYKNYSRPLFKAGALEYIQPSMHKPYGWLALYDDMTEADIRFLFQQYKEARKKRLKKQGIHIRRYFCANMFRDHEWVRIAEQYRDKPDYHEIARIWAKKNQFQVKEMVLRFLWEDPGRCESMELRKLFKQAKDKKEKYMEFVVKNGKRIKGLNVNNEKKDYIEFQLPRLIRSAVSRYNKKYK